MKGLLRRPLGIVGTGILWAVGWAGLDGVLLSLPAALGVPVEPGRILAMISFAGLLGFAGGSGFGVVLTLLEYHDRLDDLSAKWIALGGGIVGLLILAFVGTGHWGAVVALTILVTASALGMVAFAKRARRRQL